MVYRACRIQNDTDSQISAAVHDGERENYSSRSNARMAADHCMRMDDGSHPGAALHQPVNKSLADRIVANSHDNAVVPVQCPNQAFRVAHDRPSAIEHFAWPLIIKEHATLPSSKLRCVSDHLSVPARSQDGKLLHELFPVNLDIVAWPG